MELGPRVSLHDHTLHPPQLADRTESLNRSIQKRCVSLLSGILKDTVG